MSNHVLSGALIGRAAPHPLAAFVAGVVSHLALDAAPHWGDGRPIRQALDVAVPDGLVGAGTMAAITATTAPGLRLRVLAGMAGAAFLDLDKPCTVFFGFSPFPRSVDALHARIQRESPRRMPQELLVFTAGAALVALLTRRDGTATGTTAAQQTWRR